MAKEEKKVKKVKNTKKEKKNKEGFFKNLKKEIGLVKWPSVKDIIKYTVATIVFCVILIAFFQVLDIILAYIKELFN